MTINTAGKAVAAAMVRYWNAGLHLTEIARLVQAEVPGITLSLFNKAADAAWAAVQTAPARTDACQEHLGGCPTCGRSDGYMNVGRDHWGNCKQHGVKWPIGANLFSSWRDETEADWLANEKRLATLRQVEPLRMGDFIPGGRP